MGYGVRCVGRYIVSWSVRWEWGGGVWGFLPVRDALSCLVLACLVWVFGSEIDEEVRWDCCRGINLPGVDTPAFFFPLVGFLHLWSVSECM